MDNIPAETAAQNEPAESAQPTGTRARPEDTKPDELPEWAREQLTKANNEAAKYRVQAKEAAEKAKTEAAGEFGAKLEELSTSKAALAAELESARLGLVKLQAALSVGVPGESAAEFADLLKGTNEDEIKAHAEKVKELFGASKKSDRPVDPSQGAYGSEKSDPGPGLSRLLSAYQS
ncbi:hypothetical protein [Amycolatopsis anabasis]|uniref:hypothetical protein n=1 Tax=Amycolatopsis anabasis TaxID=1840409 RepID=UPI00131A8025|nr:hypothetical protein [Amycolatopsis anabasis]